MSITFTTRQHSVGHGFFHTATVQFGDVKFNYVYDCGGSKKGLDREVKSYLRMDLGDQDIDAIFISHLHADHVSGFKRLLKKKRAKYVYLPYLTPSERLVVAAEMVVEGKNFNHEITIDPQGWFSRKADTVVELRRGEGGVETDGVEPFPDTMPRDFSKDMKYHSEHSSIQKKSDDHFDEMTDMSPVMCMSGFWQFLLFVSEADPKKLKKFEEVLLEKLPSLGRLLGTDNLASGDFVNAALVILEDREKRGELAKCYLEIFGKKNFNKTSLCVWSGPRFKIDDFSLHHIDSNYYRHSYRMHLNRCAWFGIGDAELKSEKEVDEILKHFRHFLKMVHTMNLPHHGSINNFHPALYEFIDPEHIFVTCSGRSKKHPSPEVRARLKVLGHGLFEITDDKPGFHEKIHFIR